MPDTSVQESWTAVNGRLWSDAYRDHQHLLYERRLFLQMVVKKQRLFLIRTEQTLECCVGVKMCVCVRPAAQCASVTHLHYACHASGIRTCQHFKISQVYSVYVTCRL